MKSVRRLRNRRTFLAGTMLAGVGSAWVGLSSSWTARFLRERVKETFRNPAPAPNQPKPGEWADNAVTLAWLGHSTVLINFYGVRILTDPTFFPRIGVDAGVGTIGPKRLISCALKPAELPPIDLVLVSHAHFDHLDTPSLAAVRGRPALVMAKDTSDIVSRKNFSSVQELRWGDSTKIITPRGDVFVRGLEVKHWGARLRNDTHRGYNGFIIEREGRRILFGGDTADTPVFADYRKHGPFDAALMPIGAYDPWIRNHCTPEQAVVMADAARARLFIPIHHQTFRLSSEPTREPIERTEAALAKEQGRLGLREVGETVVLQS
jgi:L-ascorbate metabolism protein UlaG (beta-lactamase superfamily)